MKFTPFRESARLLFQTSGGHSKVLLERTSGLGMADGGICWDVPTEIIPPRLRIPGSRFLLVGDFVIPEQQDTIEELRAAIRSTRVEELA